MEKKKIILEEIPDHIVNKILLKMPCVELIRMRKTCSYINNTVEENREAFSSRVDVGIDISVVLYTENNMTKFLISHRDPETAISIDAHLEDHFSGVSVASLRLGSPQVDQQGLFAQFLRRMNFNCDILSFWFFMESLDYILQLMDFVECRTIEFQYVPNLKFVENSVDKLLTSRKKSTFLFDIDDENVILEQLEVFMNFKIVRCRRQWTTEQIHLLITKITKLTDLGTLEKISFMCSDENLVFHDQNFVFPPSKLLWEVQEAQYMEPDFIAKFDLIDDKCALVFIRPFDVHIPDCSPKEVDIEFMSNTPEVILNVLIEKLRIQDVKASEKEKYLESSEDERFELIREIYTARREIRRRY